MPSPDQLDAALRSFAACVAAGRVAHAYLVIGPPEGEALAFADRAAALLFCTADQGAGRPCGACRGCRQAAAHAHPDLMWAEPRKKSRIIDVDAVRELCRQVGQTPFAGGWKAAVIACADRMKAEAANAFLKTLEEPAGRTVFFLLTDAPQSLLPTVVSRCQRIVVCGEAGADPALEEAVIAILAAPSAGAFGGRDTAMRLCGLLAKIKAEIKAGVRAEDEAGQDAEGPAGEPDAEAADQDADKETLEARVSARYRQARESVLRCIMRWYRDVLLCACGVEEDLWSFASFAGAVRRQARGLSRAHALRNLDRIEVLRRRLELNFSDATALALAFCEMASSSAPETTLHRR